MGLQFRTITTNKENPLSKFRYWGTVATFAFCCICWFLLYQNDGTIIVINGNIRIEILQIKGKQIRLGITAPSSVKVLRGELPAEAEDPCQADSGPKQSAITETGLVDLSTALMSA